LGQSLGQRVEVYIDDANRLARQFRHQPLDEKALVPCLCSCGLFGVLCFGQISDCR
jgi:hypothetical protein